MQEVSPKIFHIAATQMDLSGLKDLLKDIGCPNWRTNAPSSAEQLIEVAGKFCYKSFDADMNPNLTKVRESDNKGYIKNIISSKHGSVLEHGHDTYAIVNVSRVFTHELVRHRLCNFSQESLRFVRLTDLKYYYPDIFRNEKELDKLYDSLKEKNIGGVSSDRYRQLDDWKTDLASLWIQVFHFLETAQNKITEILYLDELPGNFTIKKKITSAMRRLAPIGLSTGIIITTNHRNWRHLIEMRTSCHAEEEIRKVFYKIAIDLKKRYPNIYQDMSVSDFLYDDKEIKFEHSKV